MAVIYYVTIFYYFFLIFYRLNWDGDSTFNGRHLLLGVAFSGNNDMTNVTSIMYYNEKCDLINFIKVRGLTIWNIFLTGVDLQYSITRTKWNNYVT